MTHALLAVAYSLTLFSFFPVAASGPTGLQDGRSTASLQGRVLDPMRAPIAGARVTATPLTQGAPSSAVTDEHGAFTLITDSGRYSVTAAAPGFVESAVNVEARSDGTVFREFVLRIAGVQEHVTVSATPAYGAPAITSATKTATPLRDVPQSVTVVTEQLIKDQLMTSIGDVVRYVPGITAHQGENNRDQVIIRGNSSSADFFVNGVRDDVQYYRDLYNLDRVEALKGPNAMIFGRGGAGGVINRVTKDAGFRPVRALSVQGGLFGNKRFSGDLDQPLGDKVAFRLNGLIEDSGSFRRDVTLERHGITPTLTLVPSGRTKINLRYEYLDDTRVADRGITSFLGRPADIDVATFYGDPAASHVRARVNIGSMAMEHRIGGATLRNHTTIADYDRSYQNFVPGAATAEKLQVSLSSYNNATARRNMFNQTDVTFAFATAGLRHTVVAGAEVGWQFTDNFRNSGFFDNGATSILVPFDNPLTTRPVTFRQGATDADNHVRTDLAAVYAQDQLQLSPAVQVVGGLRFDRFDLRYENNRNGEALDRPDGLVSPRAGLILKPIAPLSLYSSYSVSYLPSSGDQFSSLTAVTQQMKPESFNNYEAGGKWTVVPDLELTGAVYLLDRKNTRSTDQNDPARIVQTGSQRSTGSELGINGRITRAWSIAGGYAHQNVFITSATSAAKAGAQAGQVPHHTVSLWNNYQLRPRVGAALGVLYRSDMFATIDNTVTLPGYVRADAAAYIGLTRQLRLQINGENIFDKRYYINADSNTNISPGAPRTVRIAVTSSF